MKDATLNVRLPEDLKEHGMQVLDREGVSVTGLVRGLFAYLEQAQDIPEFLLDVEQESKRTAIKRKKEALDSLVGIIPSNIDAASVRHERLMHKTRPGVRE